MTLVHPTSLTISTIAPMNTMRKATSDDLAGASSTLAMAFEDYAWTNFTIAPDDHLTRIRDVQNLCLKEIALPYGLIVVNDDMSAVAAFTQPAASAKVDPSVWSRISERMGPAPSSSIELDLPAPLKEASWGLATVGVLPMSQGQGLGSAAIQYGLHSLDSITGTVTAVHLETSDQRNVRLYERLGFRTYAETSVDDGPMVWSMQRG